MNSKGQIGIGPIMGAFLSVIVGLVLLVASAGYVGTATNTATVVNSTITMPAAAGTLELTGQEYVSGAIVTNATGGETVAATNYTLSEVVSATTGVKTIQLTANAGPYVTESVNISYVFGPDGYIDSSGGRATAGLILVFFALAIAVIILVPTLRSKIIG